MNLNFKIAAAAIIFNTLIAAAFAPAMFVAAAVIVMMGSIIALRTIDGQLPPAINAGEVVPVPEAVEDESVTADKPKKPRRRYNKKPKKDWSAEVK